MHVYHSQARQFVQRLNQVNQGLNSIRPSISQPLMGLIIKKFVGLLYKVYQIPYKIDRVRVRHVEVRGAIR